MIPLFIAALCVRSVFAIAELDALPVGNDLQIVFPRENEDSSEVESHALLVTKIMAGKTIVEIHEVDDFLPTERPVFAITQDNSTMLVFKDIPSVDFFGPKFEDSYETRRFHLEAQRGVPKTTILAAIIRLFNKDFEFNQIKIWSSSAWGEAFADAVSKTNFTSNECIYASSISDATLFKFLDTIKPTSFKVFNNDNTQLSEAFFQQPTVRHLKHLEVMAIEEKELTDDALAGLEAIELNIGFAPKITPEGLRRVLKPALEARWAPVISNKLIKSDLYASYPTFRQLFIIPSFKLDMIQLLDGFNATKELIGDGSIETWSFPVGERTLFLRHNIWHGDLHQFDVDCVEDIQSA